LTVEHNILPWLDEKSKRHRRMLWKKVFRVIEAYLIRNGIANTMWCPNPDIEKVDVTDHGDFERFF
jgi:hypothetical protein